MLNILKILLGAMIVFYFSACGSSSSGGISNDSTITHKGITYGIVTSPITGKKWLDRNLGATQICTKSRDDGNFSNDGEYVADQKDCFGDLYQWGRLTDGHEKINYIDQTQNQSIDYDPNLTIDDNGIIKTTGADSDKFIISPNNPWDWTDKDGNGSKRVTQWSKTDGTSICPNGFRVPTIDELKAETIEWSDPTMIEDESIGRVKVTNRDTAFKNFLKFPVSGFRSGSDASLYVQGDSGRVWSSSPDGSNGHDIHFNDFNAGGNWNSRAHGFSVRCIKYLDTVPPVLSHSTQTFTTTVGTPLILPTVTATDNIDGNVNVVQNGSVDFDTAGTYTITYTATDSAGNSASITHTYIVYGIVTSPITGKEWLDRNLGATQVCTKSRDDGSFPDNDTYVADQKDCFGDLYQWGRLTDGHEKRDSSSIDYDPSLTIEENGIIKATGADSDKFIKSPNNPYDWTDKDGDGSKRKAVWEKTDGTSICPVGFRVPTIDELKAETIEWSDPNMIEDESIGKVKVTNRDTAFKNFLKFPVSGYRYYGDASLGNLGHYGFVWSSSPNGSNGQSIHFNDSNAFDSSSKRAYVFSVRCLRD